MELGDGIQSVVCGLQQLCRCPQPWHDWRSLRPASRALLTVLCTLCPAEADDDENDMLDLAFGLTDT